MAVYKVGFIGAGNIASAIFGGITHSGYIKPENVFVFDTDSSKTEKFSVKGATELPDIKSVIKKCDFVFLTVKPQIYPIVLEDIKNSDSDACYIDVAAGISIDYVKKSLGYNAPVVRAMPNTPLMCGMGSTALVKREPVTDEQFAFVKGCFDSCGISAVVDESQINAITAVSGSAPAYILKMAAEFIRFAVVSGIDPEDSKKLVLQVFAGSAKLATENENSIDQLIKNVTSPNGTTEAGLKSLTENRFEDIINCCLCKTVLRAEELSK